MLSLAERESRTRVSDRGIIYHFIAGHAQLLCQQIVRLSGHFPQGSISVIQLQQLSSYNLPHPPPIGVGVPK